MPPLATKPLLGRRHGLGTRCPPPAYRTGKAFTPPASHLHETTSTDPLSGNQRESRESALDEKSQLGSNKPSRPRPMTVSMFRFEYNERLDFRYTTYTDSPLLSKEDKRQNAFFCTRTRDRTRDRDRTRLQILRLADAMLCYVYMGHEPMSSRARHGHGMAVTPSHAPAHHNDLLPPLHHTKRAMSCAGR